MALLEGCWGQVLCLPQTQTSSAPSWVPEPSSELLRGGTDEAHLSTYPTYLYHSSLRCTPHAIPQARVGPFWQDLLWTPDWNSQPHSHHRPHRLLSAIYLLSRFNPFPPLFSHLPVWSQSGTCSILLLPQFPTTAWYPVDNPLIFIKQPMLFIPGLEILVPWGQLYKFYVFLNVLICFSEFTISLFFFSQFLIHTKPIISTLWDHINGNKSGKINI